MDGSEADRKDKLWSLIDTVEIAMMTTWDGGTLRSRPMWSVKNNPDRDIVFFTRASSHKSSEIAANPRVNLSYSDPRHQHYVSVSGTAELSDDRERMGALWSEPLRAWFPQGLDDPDMRLLSVEIDAAEYWDTPSSTMVHLYGYAKAVITGRPPNPGENEKLGPVQG